MPDDSIMCGSFFIKKELFPIILEKKIKNVNSLIEILVKNSEILKLGKVYCMKFYLKKKIYFFLRCLSL